ncbi:MAG TPA: SRPBCC family protein [Burkholderiales bacterium]|nr:SRPBCC family protein [Burkholderiales bacterium]
MVRSYFNAEAGLLDSKVFSSARVYRDEIERLFSRAWQWVAPLAWLGRTGDLVTSAIGETPVVAWRDAQGGLGVYVNRCVASDEPLTDLERGSADALVCPCHGWAYGPGEVEGMARPERVARTASIAGFLFSSLDAEAVALEQWLGDFSWGLRLIDQQFPGGLEVHGGTALRTLIRCNWKVAAEAYAGDVYSDLTLTKATREVLEMGAPLTERQGFQIATRAGAIAVLTEAGERGSETMIPLFATLFPNLSYDGRGGALHVWHPKGAMETEVHTFCLVGRDEPFEVKENRRRRWQRLFGPAGFLTQDHAAAWSEVTRATHQARSHPLNLQMGLGEERTSKLPGRVSGLASEMNQRTFYDWWQSQLAAEPPVYLSARQQVVPPYSIPASTCPASVPRRTPAPSRLAGAHDRSLQGSRFPFQKALVVEPASFVAESRFARRPQGTRG